MAVVTLETIRVWVCAKCSRRTNRSVWEECEHCGHDGPTWQAFHAAVLIDAGPYDQLWRGEENLDRIPWHMPWPHPFNQTGRL